MLSSSVNSERERERERTANGFKEWECLRHIHDLIYAVGKELERRIMMK